jgi:hypothetical protein
MLRHEAGLPNNGGQRHPQQTTSRPCSSPCIAREEILVVSKMSRFEREKVATGLSDDELVARFNRIGESGLRILATHLKHQGAIATCARELSPGQVISLDTPEGTAISARFKVIIALGGDDFFKLVSHRVPEDLPILGKQGKTSLMQVFARNGAHAPFI